MFIPLKGSTIPLAPNSPQQAQRNAPPNNGWLVTTKTFFPTRQQLHHMFGEHLRDTKETKDKSP